MAKEPIKVAGVRDDERIAKVRADIEAARLKRVADGIDETEGEVAAREAAEALALSDADVNGDGLIDGNEVRENSVLNEGNPGLPVITLDKITNDFGREDLNQMRDKLNLVMGNLNGGLFVNGGVYRDGQNDLGERGVNTDYLSTGERTVE